MRIVCFLFFVFLSIVGFLLLEALGHLRIARPFLSIIFSIFGFDCLCDDFASVDPSFFLFSHFRISLLPLDDSVGSRDQFIFPGTRLVFRFGGLGQHTPAPRQISSGEGSHRLSFTRVLTYSCFQRWKSDTWGKKTRTHRGLNTCSVHPNGDTWATLLISTTGMRRLDCIDKV